MAVESRECCLSRAMGSSCRGEGGAGEPEGQKPWPLPPDRVNEGCGPRVPRIRCCVRQDCSLSWSSFPWPPSSTHLSAGQIWLFLPH